MSRSFILLTFLLLIQCENLSQKPINNPGYEIKSHQGGAVVKSLRQKALWWFVHNTHHQTGMTLDRSDNWRSADPIPMSSIAATGYYLSVLPEMEKENIVSRAEASKQAEKTMRFLLNSVEHHDGIMYHFVHWDTGRRWKNSETSILDTAICLNGCMVAVQKYPHLSPICDSLIKRIKWRSYAKLYGSKVLLSMGWMPEKGYLGPCDVCSSEMLMPYILAAGSSDECKANWYDTEVVWGCTSNEFCMESGYKILNPSHPLFTSNIGLNWIDLRGLKDARGIDLDGNARLAALANRACFSTASGWWGVSAGDSPRGYQSPGLHEQPDGTVCPLAALGAYQWIPGEIEEDLECWHKTLLWEQVFGYYGLCPFNERSNWIGNDVIGIDLGGFLLAEINFRSGLVYDLWKSHPVAKKGLEKLGFR